MKNCLFIVFCIAVFFISCKKKSSPSFSVTGISEVYVSKLDTVFIPLQVYNPSGQAITLSVSNLPGGVSAGFIPASGSAKNYADTMFLYADYTASAQVTTATIIATSASGEKQSYPFDIYITAPQDCESSHIGNFNTFPSCIKDSSGSPFVQTVIVGSDRNQIYISNFDNTGRTIVAQLNCRLQSINIAPQLWGGDSIKGYGSFTGTNMAINFSIYGHDTDFCKLYMYKQ